MIGGQLEILSGDLEGRRYEVDEREFTIGRSPGCDIVIPKKYISRQHARIVRSGGGFVIDGLSEKNPILLEGSVVREHALEDGDVFELCGIKFRFRMREAAARSDSSFGPSSLGSLAADDEFVETDAGFPAYAASRKGADPAEDSWQAPPQPGGLPAAATRSGGGVVFEVEDEDADEESGDQTGELPLDKLAQVSSRASGLGPAPGESSNERTAALGAAVDRDDPNYDPFAAVDAVGKDKKRERDPNTDRMLKIASVVGVVGIVLAFFVQRQIAKPPELVYETVKEPIRLRVGEVRVFQEPWRENDRPFSSAATRLDGQTQGQDYLQTRPPGYVEIEWLVPHVQRRSVLLLRGLSEGETSFELRFPSHRVKIWNVVVEGSDPHLLARDQRREELRKKNPRDLRHMVQTHMGSGDTLTRERDSPAKEGYYRQALDEYRLATDAADALQHVLAQRGQASPQVLELVRRCEDAETKAEREWEDFIQMEGSLYQGMVGRKEPGEDCVFQLRRLLRGIGHTCDPRYKRLEVLLREAWSVTLVNAPDRCPHDVDG